MAPQKSNCFRSNAGDTSLQRTAQLQPITEFRGHLKEEPLVVIQTRDGGVGHEGINMEVVRSSNSRDNVQRKLSGWLMDQMWRREREESNNAPKCEAWASGR